MKDDGKCVCGHVWQRHDRDGECPDRGAYFQRAEPSDTGFDDPHAEVARLIICANSARICLERHRARYGSNHLIDTAPCRSLTMPSRLRSRSKMLDVVAPDAQPSSPGPTHTEQESE